MKQNDFYAVFGGFGIQHWGNIYAPDITGNSDGLTVCRVDGQTGRMTVHSQGHGITSPSTVVVSPDQKYIYAGNEDHDFRQIGFGGGLTAFRFDMASGTAEKINDSLSFGSSTCYVTLDKTGKYIFVANHGSKFYCTRYVERDGALTPEVLRDEGCVTVFAVREDGGVGPLVDRLVLEGTGIDPVEHASAHPHSIVLDDRDFAIIPNKGGDSIYVCRFDRQAEKLRLLSVFRTEYGSSPRHAAFVPGTDFVLVQNEYDGHLCSYRLDRAAGTLTRISRVDTWMPDLAMPTTFKLMEGRTHPWGLDVQVHPNGRFIFNNNTQGVVATLEIDRATGELTLRHQFPLENMFTRGLQIDRSGRFLVVTGVTSEKAVVLDIDQQTGALTLSSEVALPTPTALRFLYPQES